MKPIAIVQHEADVGPGRFERYLAEKGLPHQIVRLFAGETLPASAEPYAGLCSLGGSMSVNDDLPWIDQELSLMREADQRDVPIIGHCLGGQLLAKALGASVTRNAMKEIGWGAVEADDSKIAREWVGDAPSFEVFQWHGDAFALPRGARRFLTSKLCANQAFVIERGNLAHLGMQFHVEMTPQLVREWATDPKGAQEIEEAFERQGGIGVQRIDEILDRVDERSRRMSAIADGIYDRWVRGLRR